MNLNTRTILYIFLRVQIPNTDVIAESGEGDMPYLRSLRTKLKATGQRSHTEPLKAPGLSLLVNHFL